MKAEKYVPTKLLCSATYTESHDSEKELSFKNLSIDNEIKYGSIDTDYSLVVNPRDRISIEDLIVKDDMEKLSSLKGISEKSAEAACNDYNGIKKDPKSEERTGGTHDIRIAKRILGISAKKLESLNPKYKIRLSKSRST
ncbi:MAG: hypothetical protein JKY54_02710 [Flavobacteriales bacterium]|nr:hypothetical protein [Flavobacteriales bacterium]